MATTTKAMTTDMTSPEAIKEQTKKSQKEIVAGVLGRLPGPVNEGLARLADVEEACERAIAEALASKRPAALRLVRTLQDCAETCRSTSEALSRSSVVRQSMCGLCVEILEICAFRCMATGGMEAVICAEICRNCAMSCRTLTRGLI